MTGDYQAAYKLSVEDADHLANPSLAYGAANFAAYEAVYLHDNATSQFWTQRLLERDGVYGVDLRDRRVLRQAHFRLANEDRWSEAADVMAQAEQGITLNTNTAYFFALEAMALAKAGRVAEAKVIVNQLPPRCYTCMIAVGAVAQAAGDVAGSEQAFAEAIRFGPSLPRGYLEVGLARLARGDLEGAIAMARLGHAKGPHNADVLELWGEALMGKGDVAGAADKFQAAAQYAPRWGRDRLRWGQALAKLGKAEDAKAQFRLASGLTLSAADRAQLPKA
jgi:thioredoxin-like negative regulator of GroEL